VVDDAWTTRRLIVGGARHSPAVPGQRVRPVDLRRQLAIVRAWFPFLAACVVIAGGAAFLFSNMLPKVYEANATLIVGQSLSTVSPDYNQLLVSQRLSTTYASVATKRPNLEAVITKLGLDETADQVARSVHADASLESTLLTISAQDADPARAAAIANALAEQLIAASPAVAGQQADIQKSVVADFKATQDQIEATQTEGQTLSALRDRTAAQDAQLQVLEARLVTLRSTSATLLSFTSGNASNLLTVVEPAVPPTSPASPRVLLNVLLAAMLGLFAGVVVIVVKERLDDTVKTPEDALESAGLPILGVIMRMSGDRGRSEIYRLAAVLYPRSAATESYRTLRANIEFASVDEPMTTLLVTSSVRREGKTVTAANLAVVFAQAGRRVLLVDADLRKPGVHLLFDLPNSHGLTDLLRSDKVDLHAVEQASEQDNLRILTTGPLPPNPAELLGSQRMRAILERLKAAHDLVIFDSPPLQVVTDSAILSSFVDGTLFVIGAGGGRRATVRLGRESLDRAGAHVLGAVLNLLRDPARVGHSGHYGNYGEYGASDEGGGQRPAGARTPAEGSAP